MKNEEKSALVNLGHRAQAERAKSHLTDAAVIIANVAKKVHES